MAFNLVIGGLSLLGSSFHLSLLPVMIPVIVIQAAALWWRRSYPLAVLAVIVLASFAWWFAIPARDPGSPALPFAVYAVSVYDKSRARLSIAGIAIAMIASALALLLIGDFPIARNLLPAGASSLVAWVIGDYVRSRRQFFLDLVARHRQDRETAAEEERLRIARELHDVVAHNVSLMAIQAGAARVAGNSTTETLALIEKQARDTLSELNKLLGVLRKDPRAPELAPQPTLDEVGALLKPARDAGLDATLRVMGEKRPLPAAVELSAYRIVQEAITNVMKHAGASRVEVTVDYQPDALALIVSDNGRGANGAGSGGHGLIGMRERVALFGGEMQTGSSSLGGFTVRARLPLTS